MKNIYSAFVKAQKAFSPALKASINPHFKSRYVDLAGCVEAVMDALNANGIALVQQTHESDTGVIVETTFLHESGEMLSAGKLHFPASKNDAQGFMSALTYCRRGSLMAACGIAPEDDDGNAASKKKTAAPVIPALPPVETLDLSQDEISWLADMAAEAQELVSSGSTNVAVSKIDAANLTGEQKMALWGRLDSKTRSAIKAASRVTA